MSGESANDRCSIELAIEAGEVIVNHAWLVCRSDNSAFIEIDCETKYPMPCGSVHGHDGCVVIQLMASTQAISIDETSKRILTTIGFPEFNGWRVFAFDAARYTVRVALWKPD